MSAEEEIELKHRLRELMALTLKMIGSALQERGWPGNIKLVASPKPELSLTMCVSKPEETADIKAGDAEKAWITEAMIQMRSSLKSALAELLTSASTASESGLPSSAVVGVDFVVGVTGAPIRVKIRAPCGSIKAPPPPVEIPPATQGTSEPQE
mmetsp:Transcript_25568/g.60380  ORF Transcript_25568/g.60380 Transcript_25568/m.60380 type:complete len:154 (-) Transcript_25568:15-476(-)